MCKYCNPSDDIIKKSNWEYINLEFGIHANKDTKAYIVPAIKFNRASLIVNRDNELYEVILNYCPMCGCKLPE